MGAYSSSLTQEWLFFQLWLLTTLYQLAYHNIPSRYPMFIRNSTGASTHLGPSTSILTHKRTKSYDTSVRVSVTQTFIYSTVILSQVLFFSAAPVYTPATRVFEIKGRLRALENISMWWWWGVDLHRGLYYIHSLMLAKMVATDACSASVIIYCKLCKKSASVTWVEKTSHKTADNYQAKMLEILQHISVWTLLSHSLHETHDPW